MKYNSQKPVVCIESTKDASLYFNEIVPLQLSEMITIEGSGEPELFEILKQILPKAYINESMPRGVHSNVISYVARYLTAYPSVVGIYDLPNGETLEEREQKCFPDLMIKTKELIQLTDLQVGSLFGENNFSDINIEESDPSLILSGIKLVDTSKLSWKHILELRKDEDTVKKMRKIRTFIFQNYQGKPIEFIKDDLQNRIDNYNEAAKKWGLETKDSVLKIIFSSSEAVALTAATIASIFLGLPMAIPIATAVGSSFSIGKIGLEIRKQRRDLYQFRNDSPITYLIDLQSKIPSSS